MTQPAHRAPREQTPPFILGMLTFLGLYAATVALPNLPQAAWPAVIATIGTGLTVWAFTAATHGTSK